MQYITATQLDQWADSTESRSVLPELVKKLIYASKHGLTKNDIPIGDQVQEPGWDGIVVSTGDKDNEIFLPNGTCLIEMGTNNRPSEKANDDFSKRCNNSLGYPTKDCYFIFITPRTWAGRRKWEQEQNEKGIWKGVKVIDASTLVDWIEACPSVCSWFLSKLGRNNTFLDIKTYWHEWSENEKGDKLDLSLVISGRDEFAKDVVDRLTSAHVLFLISPSSKESLIFAVASILKYGSEELKEKALISPSESATSAILNDRDNGIVLQTDYSENSCFHVNKNNVLLHCLSQGTKLRLTQNVLFIPPVDVFAFTKALTLTTGAEDVARQYAWDSGKNISILRRRLEFNGANPDWTKTENLIKLLPAFILGRWSDNSECDKKALEVLSGQKYDDCLKELLFWLHKDDSPFSKVNHYWSVKSAYDVLIDAISEIKEADIMDKLASLCEDVFSDTDNSLKDDLDSDGLIFHKFNAKYSNWLKEGLLQSLIVLSVYSNDTTIEQQVDAIISKAIHPNDLDWWLTYCSGNLLSLMAEASPNAFIDRVNEDLQSEKSAITTIFTKNYAHSSMFGNSSHYVHILSALETLAWMPEYLTDVTRILLKLCEFGSKKGYVNNAMDSLQNIYHVAFPNTYANLDQRCVVLNSLYKRFPRQLFRLCIILINNRRSGHLSISMNWRTFGKPRKNTTEAEVYKAVDSCMDNCCLLTELSDEEYIQLLNIADDYRVPYIAEEIRQKVIGKLEKEAHRYKGNQKVLNAVRHANYSMNVYRNHHSEMDSSWLTVILDKIEPNNIIERELWKFSNKYQEPATYDKDYHKIFDKKEARRDDALKEIIAKKGESGLTQLCQRAENPEIIGRLLAGFDNKQEYIELVLKNKSCPRLAGIFFRRILSEDSQFFDKIMSEKLDDKDTYLYILYSMDVYNKTLQHYLDKCSTEEKRYFWQKVSNQLYVDREDINTAIEGFADVDRFDAAALLVEQAGVNQILVESQLLLKVLQGLITHADQMRSSISVYDLDKAIEDLDKRDDIDEQAIINVEILYCILKDEDIYPNLRFSKLLYKNPDQLFWLIKTTCLQASKKNTAKPTKVQIQNSKACFRILWHLRSLPCYENNTIDEEGLRKYVARLYQLGEENDSKEVTANVIGSLLGNTPIDDTFPQDVICEILEDYMVDNMLDGFRTKLYNRHGMTFRGPLEGGDIERNKAAKAEQYSQRICIKYPTVARKVFDVLKKTYLREAEHMDNDAELEKIEY